MISGNFSNQHFFYRSCHRFPIQRLNHYRTNYSLLFSVLRIDMEESITIKVQGLRWHGFEGFDRTCQFKEKGSRTRQYFGIFNEKYICCHFTCQYLDNLPLLRRFGTRQLEIPAQPLKSVLDVRRNS